jgi:hypothetical protein
VKKILVDENVLKQAIEAFVHMCHNTNATRGYNSRIVSDAMNTLGVALSQQEQEPVWDASAPWARAAIAKVDKDL